MAGRRTRRWRWIWLGLVVVAFAVVWTGQEWVEPDGSTAVAPARGAVRSWNGALPTTEPKPAWRITISDDPPALCNGDLGRDELGRWVCSERVLWGESGTEICEEPFGRCRRADPWEVRSVTLGVDWCDTVFGPSRCEEDDPWRFGGPSMSTDGQDDRWSSDADRFRFPWERAEEEDSWSFGRWSAESDGQDDWWSRDASRRTYPWDRDAGEDPIVPKPVP